MGLRELPVALLVLRVGWACSCCSGLAGFVTLFLLRREDTLLPLGGRGATRMGPIA